MYGMKIFVPYEKNSTTKKTVTFKDLDRMESDDDNSKQKIVSTYTCFSLSFDQFKIGTNFDLIDERIINKLSCSRFYLHDRILYIHPGICEPKIPPTEYQCQHIIHLDDDGFVKVQNNLVFFRHIYGRRMDYVLISIAQFYIDKKNTSSCNCFSK